MGILTELAIMECPGCRRRVAPGDGSSPIVAWYSCSDCGADWSARLRNGRPAAIEPLPALESDGVSAGTSDVLVHP